MNKQDRIKNNAEAMLEIVQMIREHSYRLMEIEVQLGVNPEISIAKWSAILKPEERE